MRWIALYALTVLTGCATVPPAASATPTAAIGQVASVGPLRVTPLALVEDSRCPALVRCVWAGRLRIEAMILMNGGSEELRREMILGEPVSLPEGKLTLVAAVPAPLPERATPPSAYRFTFTLTP